MNTLLKVGVIGCGSIADYAHIPNCFNIPSLRPVAFCDIKEDALQGALKKYSVQRGYSHHKTMLEKEDLDAVIIAASASAHFEILSDCMDRGVHIFVEKPITVNLEQAEAIYEKSRNYSGKIMVGYQLRFVENHKIAKRLMLERRIGDLVFFYIRAETLVIKPEETLLIDYTTHLIDLLRYYLEDLEIERIASFQTERDGVDIGASILFQFKNGLIANIETFWVPEFSWGGVRREVELIGTHGKIRTEMTGPSVELYNEKSMRVRLLGKQKIYPKSMVIPSVPITDRGYYLALKAFADCIIEDRVPPVTVLDGYMAIKIADAAKRSRERGEFASIE